MLLLRIFIDYHDTFAFHKRITRNVYRLDLQTSFLTRRRLLSLRPPRRVAETLLVRTSRYGVFRRTWTKKARTLYVEQRESSVWR